MTTTAASDPTPSPAGPTPGGADRYRSARAGGTLPRPSALGASARVDRRSPDSPCSSPLATMCGRFGLADPRRLAHSATLRLLNVATVADGVPDPLPPRFNVAPTTPVLAALDVRRAGAMHRTLAMLRWGLVPRWARDTSIGNRLANARAETVDEKPSFREAWSRGQRCAILADVFYEWQDVGAVVADPRNGDPGTTGRRPVRRQARPAKQPWALALAEREPFAFAGLWERWRDPRQPDAAPLVTCTIITTAPNVLVAPIHDRMPVILTGDALAEWVDRETTPAAACRFLRPYPAESMDAWRIDTRVNAPMNDEPDVPARIA